MRDRVLSFSNRQDFCAPARVLVTVAGLVTIAIMAGCGGGSSSSTTTTTPTASVSLSASSFTFATPISVSSTQNLTITDTGTASLSFSGFAFSGTNASDFSLPANNPCGTAIAAGANCVLPITFVSANAGSGLTATLTITDTVGSQPVALTGTAAVPTATLTPAAGLTFASQGVGSSSSAQAATLTNTGTVPLTISSAISITGTNAGDFSQTNTCPASGSALAATTSNTCAINVTFAPTASGTRTATLSVSDNATVSPQTISLTGTGASSTINLSANSLAFSSYLQGTTSPSQSVSITNSGGTTLTIASIVLGGTNPTDFALTTGTNQCTYTGQSLSAGASCSIYATFTPASVASFTATVTITDNSGGVSGSVQTVNLSGSGFNNTAQLNVSLGLTGIYVNNITTTVTVCSPGSTTNCATIPDVLVDTGSVGLRLLNTGAESAAGVTLGTQVSSLNLPTVTDSTTGYPVYECVEFGDLSYTWGQMAMATVTVGGETATQVPASAGGTANAGIPIQIVTTAIPPAGIWFPGDATSAAGPYYNPCIYSGSTPTNGPNAGTVANLGSNGILGIGNFPQDCALTQNYCTSLNTTTGQYLEYDSAGIPGTNGECSTSGTAPCTFIVEPTPLNYQAWNPVSTFATDNTGSIISLPSVGATGSGPLTGTLTFGIGTETNNAISTQTAYEMDADGNFNSVSYNGVTYTSANSGGSFLDSGSNALYISDETSLTAGGITMADCMSVSPAADTGWYCPASTVSLLPLTISGFNGTSNQFTLSVGKETSLVATGNAAMNDIAGPSCEGGSAAGCTTPNVNGAIADYWDLGLPFFFGRPIFIGISEGATFPNGYWAF